MEACDKVEEALSESSPKPAERSISAVEEIDASLASSPIGVDYVLQRSKIWSKYCAELINYVNRRTQLEAKYADDAKRLGESVRVQFNEEQFLPLKSVYFKAFKNESNFSICCNETMRKVIEEKFIKPMETWRSQHDRKRKELKMYWLKNIKNLEDAETELRKAKTAYLHRTNAYKKARDAALRFELTGLSVRLAQQTAESKAKAETKMEKYRKLEDEALQKKEMARNECREALDRVDQRRIDLQVAKEHIIKEGRELIFQAEQTTRARTVTYFQAMAALMAPVPIQLDELSDSARGYVPGSEFTNFVKQLPIQSARSREDGIYLRSRTSSVSEEVLFAEDGSSGFGISSSVSSSSLVSVDGRYRSLASSRSMTFVSNDSLASENSSVLSRKGFNYDATSPPLGTRQSRVSMRRPRPKVKNVALESHELQKIHVPTRCAHCETYTFFQTLQCVLCNLAWHKTCLTFVSDPCGGSAVNGNDAASGNSTEGAPGQSGTLKSTSTKPEMSIFGVPLTEQIDRANEAQMGDASGDIVKVPFIVRTCIAELERSGMRTRGLYRVCGVKRQIENLCEDFEQGKFDIDLRLVPPSIIASVLKLYLRQLPIPLLTFDLHQPLIDLIKDSKLDTGMDPDRLSEATPRLKHLISTLPDVHFDTLKALTLHLKRLTWFQAQNQMSASNLGIVFGPNLLWTKEEADAGPTMNSLLESPVQNKVIEALISCAYEIFDVDPAAEAEIHKEIGKQLDELETAGDTDNVSPTLSGMTCGDSGFVSCDSVPTARRNLFTSTTPDLLKYGPMTGDDDSPRSSNSDEFDYSDEDDPELTLVRRQANVESPKGPLPIVRRRVHQPSLSQAQATCRPTSSTGLDWAESPRRRRSLITRGICLKEYEIVGDDDDDNDVNGNASSDAKYKLFSKADIDKLLIQESRAIVKAFDSTEQQNNPTQHENGDSTPRG